MKVAIVTESFLPQLNGVTNSVIRVARHLRDSGHDPFIVAPTRPDSVFEGISIFAIPSFPLVNFAVGIPGPALTKILEREKPDLIHVASPFALGAQAINFASRNQIPSVAVYQTDVSGYLARYNVGVAKTMVDNFVTATLNSATLTLAPTPTAVASLHDLGVKSVKEWGRGVDLELFHPNRRFAPEVAELRSTIPTGRHVVGYVGRLAAEKQVNRFRELCDLPDTHILIVGDGPERGRLERILPRERVTFTGALHGESLANAYATIDVFVHFGEEETFGQTIQEAHASGIPVVAPHAGGPINLINHGHDGFLFHPLRPEEPREFVQRLTEDHAERFRMGESGRRRVIGRSWDAINDQLMRHYAIARKKVRTRAVA